MAGADERNPEQRSPGTLGQDRMTYDVAKLDGIALALLHLSAFGDRGVTRAWKGFKWDSLDRLHVGGLVTDPKSKPASVIRPFCADEGHPFSCPAHLAEHACKEREAFPPVINSPRMGVCGYTG